MKRYEMIKDKNYFNLIIKTGKYIKDENYVIYSLENKNNYPMFGIAIKKSIGTAVIRNRLKRQVRTIVDNNKKLFKNSYDYIIMIRKGCLSSDYQRMNNSIVQLMKGKKL